ncbi:MFS transporter [Amycolatopsis sp. CA-230715]|uniref:MFS transporter n=1 Tax=Amycolatopsis sp. CA-230715 TaxID=2745196 RepID=UPI001C0117D4|nr:MFS transporter [Amycolatopsis sp. CA-230715]QWF80022.1 Purine ribonucleoside efflux pump NepI [Amycolatopsis sp. CA-230715]
MTTLSPTRPPLLGWFAVGAVTLGIFSLVTTEILPIGLLTPIGAGFGVSDGTAGLMMTMPGLLAAVAAPAVTVATARADRRRMLCALMLVLAFADFLAALAPQYWVMVVSRVLVGVVIGAFWAIGAGLAARLVPPDRAGAATAIIFSAVPLGSVLGVPAGTFLGQAAGWRAAFAAMGILTVAVLAALAVFLPPLPAETVTRLAVLRDAVRVPGVRRGLVVTVLVVIAHFGAYTYVTPFLEGVTKIGSVTPFLLVYGVAGIAGNFAAGAVVTRRTRATFLAAASLIAASTALLPLLGKQSSVALVLLVGWGFAYGAVPVCSQIWFSRAIPGSPEAASVVFTASFQASISLGAFAGGIAVDTLSTSAALLGAGALTTLTALVLARPASSPTNDI